MPEVLRATGPSRDRPILGGMALVSGALLAGVVPARAEAPPLPSEVGPGSLPMTRAAALAGEAALPATSPEVRLGGFGLPAGAPPPQPEPEPGRRWTVTPSIGVQLMGTDNVFQTVRNRQADLITTITPALLLGAETSRFQGVLNYAPNIQFYADTPGQNRMDQRFNGQGLATLVPGLLYLDVRGASAVQTIAGGIAPESTVVTSRQNKVQTTSFQISPYLMHRFGDLATVQAGYAFQYVDQRSSADASQISLTPGGLPTFTSQHFTAHEFYAVGRSGPDLGRLAFEGRLDSTSYIGTGVLDGAYRRNASVEGRYAIIRGVSALLEGGYEQQRYAGIPGIRIDGPIWSAGVRIDFSDESRIVAKYGRRDGFNSAFLQASLALGGRTRFSASYSERLTSSAGRAADLLSTTSLDELGNPIDLATGLPAVQPFASSFLGAQSSLMRIRAASASLSQSWPRDTIALTVTNEERTPVSVAPGTVGFDQDGTSGSISWAHSFSERTTAFAYAQYGQFSSGLLGKGDVVTGSVTLSHQLQPRLLGTMQIATSSRSDQRSTGRATQNLILVALRQSF
ncbi:TIGR03016 family PEP-CTERM system-associated outer membrane protein [Roseococcus sp. SYP-B2431]|uniref:TIGR03016 family PEP-CTERM system-associated outer membrane protein n=1 Tax=Roseococcus sp. SYP-B2431 TaxID=2496640 RepID=UPI0013F3B51D|nr:TIGR03016 family PEP-CTERM system-associated outer membrane protein [Roseococcus sp. SYP-B2431]